MTQRQQSDQVRCLEYQDLQPLAAVRIFKRRYCGKSRQHQAAGRAGFARLRKQILIQVLAKHDLVDKFWLMIYQITLGTGKQLFADGTLPMAFKVTESNVTTNGVIVVNYERAGAITIK